MAGFIFMLCMVLLIPLSMIIIGKRAMIYNPQNKFDMSKYRRKVNIIGEKEWLYLSGYRTTRSMKNDETFRFAQYLFGKWWYKLGLIIIAPSIIAMFFVFGKSKHVINLWGLIIVGVQCVFMAFPYIPIERALKKNFDTVNEKELK